MTDSSPGEMMNTKQKLIELKKLAGNVATLRGEEMRVRQSIGETYHRRAVLSREVLADPDWIGTEFDGDLEKAIKAVEDGYFADLSGAMTVTELHEILSEFEEVTEWREHGFNLLAMLALARTKKRERREPPTGEPATRRAVKLADHEAVIDQLNHQRVIAKKYQDQTEELKADNERLRAELRDAHRQLAVQEGRIKELERLVARELAAA